ncbi:small glutamine-rich tetratricopeptide repeat-containing protein alpha-like [Anopheles bellator]|uniref:small glutamine-rich tetratricopeptide repeat-containing protein alpha-like n=1 Tax=Anopheles bellator TaxID=139047 RepID=UPI00264847F3|nr:small glutamine-rich tetratricopeptide repeat-containing protein alpha-like [Anopheles bellator]
MTQANATKPKAAPPEKEGGKSNLNLTSDELKEEGNRCVKAGNFTEAILHYTHAIKLSPSDAILYSNRSLAFCKLQQYYYANEDAEKAIVLNPTWAKGYYRKAEVSMGVGQYDTALLSYGKALQLQPQDMGIILAARKAASLSNADRLEEKRAPLIGSAIGCVVGLCIVLADMLLTEKPTIKYTTLMVLVVLIIAGIGFGIAKMIRYYKQQQRKGLLEPPLDLLEEFQKTKDDINEDGSPSGEQRPVRNRYTKAQARQRLKKAKS